MKLAVGETGVTLETMFQESQTLGIGAVANQHGMTRQRLVALFQQSGLLPSGSGARDPSKEEIQKACRELQDQWTPEQARARWVGSRSLSNNW